MTSDECSKHGPAVPVLPYTDGYVIAEVCGWCWFEAIREQQIAPQTVK